MLRIRGLGFKGKGLGDESSRVHLGEARQPQLHVAVDPPLGWQDLTLQQLKEGGFT